MEGGTEQARSRKKRGESLTSAGSSRPHIVCAHYLLSPLPHFWKEKQRGGSCLALNHSSHPSPFCLSCLGSLHHLGAEVSFLRGAGNLERSSCTESPGTAFLRNGVCQSCAHSPDPSCRAARLAGSVHGSESPACAWTYSSLPPGQRTCVSFQLYPQCQGFIQIQDVSYASSRKPSLTPVLVWVRCPSSVQSFPFHKPLRTSFSTRKCICVFVCSPP